MTCEFPNRNYSQYSNKPKAISWYEIIPGIGSQFCQTYEKLSTSYDIDTNEGRQLDVIGRLVGENREFISTIDLEVYECNSVGDFECGDDRIQCSETSADSDDQLSDEYFRLLIKSKVAKNTNSATIDEIIETIRIASPQSGAIRLIDSEDMSFSIEIYGVIDPIVRNLLINDKIVPKPQGVRFRGFLEASNYTQCGDELAQCNGSGQYECVGFTGA